MSKRQIKLKVIPAPDAESKRSILCSGQAGRPVIKGDGNMDFVCGNCGDVLMESLNSMQVQGIVLKCSNCDSYNDTVVLKLPGDVAN